MMDAVEMDFPDESFDFVWSWGVIHHSAQTVQIIKQISRVLRPGGEVRLMVYNLDGMSAYLALLSWFFHGFWRGKSIDETLWSKTDGFMARYFTKDILSDIMSAFFQNVTAQSFGQDVDAVPLPRQLRGLLLRAMSDERLAALSNRRGGFLFMTGQKP